MRQARSKPLYPMQKEAFVSLPDGRIAHLFTLRHPEGSIARLTDYGGTLVSLEFPDSRGHRTDVVLGLPTPADWLGPHPALNTLIGRYGNRIAGGRFSLDGQAYTLPCNLGAHHLHGGPAGFHKVLWAGTLSGTSASPQLTLRYDSPAGEAGYPGALSVQVTFTLTADALHIAYHATTDAPTVLNLTHHGYFNLAGRGDILDHEVRIDAEAITEVDADLIPTGRFCPVAGTPFDFRTPHRIGDRIDAAHPLLRYGSGYDHNYVLRPAAGLRPVAWVRHPHSGREMEVLTTEPGVQLYTANHVRDLPGRNGAVYQPHAALCLETQHFPDSPNQPAFPSTVLRPGAAFTSTTVYRFRFP